MRENVINIGSIQCAEVAAKEAAAKEAAAKEVGDMEIDDEESAKQMLDSNAENTTGNTMIKIMMDYILQLNGTRETTITRDDRKMKYAKHKNGNMTHSQLLNVVPDTFLHPKTIDRFRCGEQQQLFNSEQKYYILNITYEI